jgi:drug/metabolite transporter (DMT)-like permease
MQRKLAVILSGILAGLIGPIIKLMPADIPPLTINFFRLFISFIFLAIFLPFIDKNTFKFKKEEVKSYLLIGFLIAITFSLYVVALSFAPVSNVVLISSFGVIFVAIFAYIILKEKLKANQKIAMIIALIGLIIINPFNFRSEHFIGNMLALAQTLGYGLLMVFIRKEGKTHSLGQIMWFFFFGSLFLSPVLFIYGVGSNFMSALPYLIVLGIFSTAISYGLVTYAAQKMSADTISIMSIITIPLAAILFAIVLINETLNPRIMIGGGILLMSSIVLHYIRNKHIKSIEKQLHIHI